MLEPHAALRDAQASLTTLFHVHDLRPSDLLARLAAANFCAVSRKQLRQGFTRPNRYFDSITAEVCVTIKQRTGGNGLILGSPSLVVSTSQGNGSGPPQTLEPFCFRAHRDDGKRGIAPSTKPRGNRSDRPVKHLTQPGSMRRNPLPGYAFL